MEAVLENTLPVAKPKWLKVKLPMERNTLSFVA
jgi:hypothetical protein